MNNIEPSKHSQEVRGMFARIAERYDLLNRLMTLGQDRRWRRETIRGLGLANGDRLLDIGTGTGDLAFEASRQEAGVWIVACDFTPAMIRIGQDRQKTQDIQWVVADAHSLPFAEGAFNAVVSGFLLRNVSDLDRALTEQARILRDRGAVACLDTSPPRANLLRPFLHVYFRWIIPALGRWFAGDEAAYRYLPETTRSFLSAPALKDTFQSNGFKDITFARRMLGTIAIHWATKDSPNQVSNRPPSPPVVFEDA